MTTSASQVDPSVRIALKGLVSARWVLLLIVVGVGIAGELIPSLGTDFVRWFGEGSNLPAIAITVVVWAGTNLATAKWIDTLASFGRHVAGLHVVGDVVALAVLIGLTGGVANPFTVLFVVPITLATQVSPRWTWGTAIASIAAFGILLDIAPGDFASHGHHMGAMAIEVDSDASPYSAHLKGMWLSLGLAGALITFFVHRIALGIAAQRDELSTLRDVVRNERELASICTLAAGAAHELGTPLATLSVLAGELRHMEPEEKEEAIETMRGEIARCKRIIGSMASPELRAEVLSLQDIKPWRMSEIGDELENSEICCWNGDGRRIQFVPKALVLSIVRELVANACTASSPVGSRNCDKVSVDGIRAGDGLEIVVADTGYGMSDETRLAATDPFFTTKGRPENMGLGLFLVSAQLRSYGGRLTIESSLGKGTKVKMQIPDKEDV